MVSDGAPPAAPSELAEQSAGTGDAPQATPPQPPDAGAQLGDETAATPQPSAPREDAPAPDPSDPPAAPSLSWATLSPEDRARLLSEADPEELRKHERVSGLAGQMADRLTKRRVQELRPEDLPPEVRERLAQQLLEQQEAKRREEYEATLGQSGEFYTLGQQRWEEIQRRKEQASGEQTRQAVERDLFGELQREAEAYAATLPPEVVDKTAADVGEKLADLTPRQQYHAWMTTLTRNMAAFERDLEAKRQQEEWEKKKLPAYEQRWLAARNGSEPSPETDGGAQVSVREITDELIDAMSLDEFKAVWDMTTDKPKAGYRYKATRGVDPRQVKTAGRAF